MKEIPISEFKANCSALLDRVRKTKKPIRITRFGKPIAEIRPASRDWLGFMAGRAEIKGDIVSPVIDPDDFEALRD